jgi:predicted HicB family RNase H-like nuclease
VLRIGNTNAAARQIRASVFPITRMSKTFPLRIPASLKSQVTLLSKREGVSLNQFISLAVAEKVARLEHQVEPDLKSSTFNG